MKPQKNLMDENTYTLYNTGDQVWREFQDGKWVVVRVVTHDGLVSDENGLIHLVGLEKHFHSLEVKALRALYKALYE